MLTPKCTLVMIASVSDFSVGTDYRQNMLPFLFTLSQVDVSIPWVPLEHCRLVLVGLWFTP